MSRSIEETVTLGVAILVTICVDFSMTDRSHIYLESSGQRSSQDIQT